MKAIPVSETVSRIPVVQPDLVNVYLVGGLLIDSGGRLGSRRLLQVLSEYRLSSHVLTHAHMDHQGCSRAVCREFGIPLFCGEGDREAAESGNQSTLMRRPRPMVTKLMNLLSGPGHPVAGALSEGDEIGGLTVIETPGHTPGHLAFWDRETRVLILGDVLFHRNPVTFRKGLSEPFRFATFDRTSNLRSARKLASLDPETVCFGHGAPLTDGDLFKRYVEGLPRL
jgi:glyoxylase-like metal-dependent hydrolase (beta-lactamase superfamily II)